MDEHGAAAGLPSPFTGAESDTLSNMQLNLAQVLNTIAHEIRTPLAVSQGYLKLYLDGRLTNADDQRRAFQQTRDALGTLATLATDMGKVGSLSDAPAPALLERVPAPELVQLLKGAGDVNGAQWIGEPVAHGSVASNSAADLVRAIAIVAKAAFDEAREQQHVLRADAGSELVMLAGTPEAIPALGAGPDAAGAQHVNFAKGGKGLRLIWAAFVLQQHRAHTWTHQDHRASVGFRFPLVQA
jgi:hypothetical protein